MIDKKGPTVLATQPVRMLAPSKIDYEAIPSLIGATIRTCFKISLQERAQFEAGTLLDKVYGEALHLPEYPQGLLEGFHSLSLLDALTHPFLDFNSKNTLSWNYGL